MKLTSDDIRDKRAFVSRTPILSGDGYGYGGVWMLTIGDVSIVVGEESRDAWLADEIARRWNTTP